MEYIKAFIKGFKEGLNPTNWSKKDIVPFIFIFLLGFFFSDIKEFVLSLFN